MSKLIADSAALASHIVDSLLCCSACCAKRPAASDLVGLREAVVLGLVQLAGSCAGPVQYVGSLQRA